VTTTVDRRGRRAAIAVLVAIAATATGCSDSRLLTGAYRTSDKAPVLIEGVPGLEDGAYLELVLGEFGPDVAGIVKIYANKSFIQPIEGVCRCRYLTGGRFEGGVLVFAFKDPSPCVADVTGLVSASLTESGSGDTLEGPIGRDLNSARSVRFDRTTSAGDLSADDKSCDEIGTEVPADSGPGDEAPDVGEGAE